MQLDSWPSHCLHSQQTKDSVDLQGAMSHNPVLGALKLPAALLWMVSKRNTFELFIDLENGNPANTQKGQPELQLHNQYCRGTWQSKLPYYTTACVGVPLKARHVETSKNMVLNLVALRSGHNHKHVPVSDFKRSVTKCSSTSVPWQRSHSSLDAPYYYILECPKCNQPPVSTITLNYNFCWALHYGIHEMVVQIVPMSHTGPLLPTQ